MAGDFLKILEQQYMHQSARVDLLQYGQRFFAIFLSYRSRRRVAERPYFIPNTVTINCEKHTTSALCHL